MTAGHRGIIAVTYLEEKPPETEGPFLAEFERDLINSLADSVSSYLNRKQAETATSTNARADAGAPLTTADACARARTSLTWPEICTTRNWSGADGGKNESANAPSQERSPGHRRLLIRQHGYCRTISCSMCAICRSICAPLFWTILGWSRLSNGMCPDRRNGPAGMPKSLRKIRSPTSLRIWR